jgi:hypothetical protein
MGKVPPLDVAATVLGTSNDGKEAETSQNKPEMLDIIGDLMRSILLVQYYPQYKTFFVRSCPRL